MLYLDFYFSTFKKPQAWWNIHENLSPALTGKLDVIKFSNCGVIAILDFVSLLTSFRLVDLELCLMKSLRTYSPLKNLITY